MLLLKRCLCLCSVIALLNGCSLLGIHLSVHNPKPGKYPSFNEETILLGELTPIRQSFDVVFYDLDIWLDPTVKTLGGWVETRAKALTAIDSIQLDLDDNLAVDEIRWKNREGQPLQFKRRHRAIFIALPSTVQPGETFAVQVKYHGEPVEARRPPWAGGVVWKKDADDHFWLGVACETEGASVWLPCKDHTSDEPDSIRSTFTINQPDLTVVSNGQFVSEKRTAEKASFTWKVTYPINLYNITFYAGNFARIDDSYTGINGQKLNISHYVLKPNETFAREHFKQAKDHIRVYEEVYGEYPWYRDGFRLVEAPYEGMEHQTAIAYGSGFKNDLTGVDYIILHETGHEWFGNSVTAADLADVWIQEGITTYGEALFYEKSRSKADATRHMLQYRLFIKNKRPLVGPAGRRYFNYRDSDVYTKGAWMMHTLRTAIGNDTVFFRLLRTFYDENKRTVTNSADFIETTNRITGKDFNWFFAQYLNKSKVPFFEYQVADGVLYYRWTDVSDNFDKLPVQLIFTADNKVHTVYPSTRVQTLKADAETFSVPEFRDQVALYGHTENRRLVKMFKENK